MTGNSLYDIADDNVEAAKSETLVVVHNIAELVLAQHSMINKDTGKVIANGTVEQYGTYRRIHSARETEDNLVVAKFSL